MSQYIRTRIRGGSYFFTVNLSDRNSALLIDEFTLLKKSIQSIKQQRPFKLQGWVILPDHLHCIWTLPEQDSDYSGRWREIKKKFSSACRKNDKSPARQLWQPRFWEHAIRNQTDPARHLDYIHINPVKHGYAQRIQDWPYSSFQFFVRAGRYSVDWGGEFGDSSNFNAGE